MDAGAQGHGDAATDHDIGTLSVERSNEEVRIEDRLLPAVEQKINATFYPSAPKTQVDGLIMAVEGGVSNVGRYDVVMLNRGERNGLEAGNVLSIHRVGEVVRDPRTGELLRLPDAPAGMLMVFRVFEKMSYALVLNASQPLRVNDRVSNPS